MSNDDYRPLYTIFASEAVAVRTLVQSGLLTSAKRQEDKFRERMKALTGYEVFFNNAHTHGDPGLTFVCDGPPKLLVAMTPDLVSGVRLTVTDLSTRSSSVERLHRELLQDQFQRLVNRELQPLTLPATISA